MNSGDNYKVWEFKALKRKPGEEKATKMLEKIAKQVQPIMRKHKWRVKLLSEFCPNSPSLLGLNVGAGIHVKLRLRRPNRDLDFYPFDQVLDTMLHELCHNAIGPHNDNFYKLWDELRKECEELMAKGITGTGEGFDLSGRRLGGYSRQPPLSSLPKVALAAAEKRSRLTSLLPSGPNRVGGDNVVMKALSPVQAAAMAAERRLQDDIWCGSQSCEHSGHEDVNNESAENLVHKGGNVGNLRTDNPTPSLDLISRKRSRLADSSFGLDSISHSQSSSHAGSSSANFSRPSGPVSGYNRMLHSEESAMWQCLMCTLLNKALAPFCELCGTQQPKDVPTKYSIWSCKFCTLENSVKLDKCSACDEWRYSHGPLVSAWEPNLGT